jgi:hypothetical protein
MPRPNRKERRRAKRARNLWLCLIADLVVVERSLTHIRRLLLALHQ